MSVDLPRNALLLFYPSAGEGETHVPSPGPNVANQERDGANKSGIFGPFLCVPG